MGTALAHVPARAELIGNCGIAYAHALARSVVAGLFACAASVLCSVPLTCRAQRNSARRGWRRWPISIFRAAFRHVGSRAAGADSPTGRYRRGKLRAQRPDGAGAAGERCSLCLAAGTVEPIPDRHAGGQTPGTIRCRRLSRRGSAVGVAIHAWINPFRAASISSDARGRIRTSAANFLQRHTQGRFLAVDGPGRSRRLVQRVDPASCTDLVRRYAVAGVVVDDYFYPYPGSGLPRGTFPDAAYYARYKAGGWRRERRGLATREYRRTSSVT